MIKTDAFQAIFFAINGLEAVGTHGTAPRLLYEKPHEILKHVHFYAFQCVPRE